MKLIRYIHFICSYILLSFHSIQYNRTFCAEVNAFTSTMTHPPLQKSLEFQQILVWNCCVSTHIYLSRFKMPFSLSLIVCVFRCAVVLYYISLTLLRFDFRLEQAKQNRLHLSLFLCMNMRDIYTSCSISKHTFSSFRRNEPEDEQKSEFLTTQYLTK